MASLLTTEQISAGETALIGNRLTLSQVDDLLSIFRGYLGAIANNYPLESTFTNLEDTVSSNRCAKLAACLLLWQDNQFDVSGFVATNANKTGFTDSTPGENYEIFKYAFGMFWTLPDRFLNSNQRQFNSSQGVSQKLW
jgi:hypothetical protein